MIKTGQLTCPSCQSVDTTTCEVATKRDGEVAGQILSGVCKACGSTWTC